jgi:hypothetical protein
MVWDHGEHRDIWDRFTPDLIDAPADARDRAAAAEGSGQRGDQEWITESRTGRHSPRVVRSYRDSTEWPPNGCKAVIFHGAPSRTSHGRLGSERLEGGWPHLLPRVQGRQHHRGQRLDNVRSAVQRDLEWFTGFPDEGKACVIVCGAPVDEGPRPRHPRHQAKKTRIVTVNNAWRFLHQRGHHAGRPCHARRPAAERRVREGAPKSMRFLLASQCHPDVFDALADHEVVLWHNGYGRQRAGSDGDPPAVVGPGPNQRPCILVPGGSTVGLRSLWLATFSGFRTIHMYGIDSSYAADGAHHAYAQSPERRRERAGRGDGRESLPLRTVDAQAGERVPGNVERPPRV